MKCASCLKTGFRKLGDRRATWKCPDCKTSSAPRSTPSVPSSPTPRNVDSEMIMAEIKKLPQQISSFSLVIEDIKSIKDDVQQLKNSVEFAHETTKICSDKIKNLEQRTENVERNQEDMSSLTQVVSYLEDLIKTKDQLDRLNNAEIKGIPYIESENLFDVILKLGSVIKCQVAKTDINYIVRVPTRNDPKNKNIITSFGNRYIKENFVACARALKRNISASDVGYNSDTNIYINDHVTLENKILLNKTKTAAKEHGYAFSWVKNCKIFMRKSATSPVKLIKSELDLRRL
ncbi:unnamed protein product [Diatraea saccharalis]|uniref:FP protein C-terminal domain-containing protein n=1 Tax=Diatraea saccharalis TaxID=40085 RepID=A0A9N9R6C9_9NEOP|nr:unnamed protein product [Diatraea saccharalis]